MPKTPPEVTITEYMGDEEFLEMLLEGKSIEYRGITITKFKKVSFPKKRPLLLKMLVDESLDHYGGNLMGWMVAKLAEPAPMKMKK